MDEIKVVLYCIVRQGTTLITQERPTLQRFFHYLIGTLKNHCTL